MNILLISYFFPPDRAVGGYRPSSFCKYFPEQGINVTLLTSNKEICFNQRTIQDYPSLKTICAKRSILRELGYKTKLLVILELLKLDKLLFFPDLYFPWIKKAVKKCLNFLINQQIDAIVATTPPGLVFYYNNAFLKI